MFGSLVIIGGAILQTFSTKGEKMLRPPGMSIFLGHGFPDCVVAGSVLVGELAHPQERPILGSLFNSFYFVGSLIAAAVTFETLNIKSHWSWKLPSILQMAPSMFQIAFVLMIPESPRWLVSKDRGDEALAILVKYHNEESPTHPSQTSNSTRSKTPSKLRTSPASARGANSSRPLECAAAF
jgi:MFS family permease